MKHTKIKIKFTHTHTHVMMMMMMIMIVMRMIMVMMMMMMVMMREELNAPIHAPLQIRAPRFQELRAPEGNLIKEKMQMHEMLDNDG